ncbi:MAG: hypothetical protein CM15mP45_10500 [Deltaproteobacteria bacterium]|nr:MAG: hypothetical protein CM15mP45_10500 [Deltaproteobacteria bacterium]
MLLIGMLQTEHLNTKYFLELFEDLLCQMGDRIQLNFHLSKQQHELQSHQLELNHAVQLQL